MSRAAFWLGVGAVVVGVAAVVDALIEGQGFDASGLVAVAVGLVVIAVSRRKTRANEDRNAA